MGVRNICHLVASNNVTQLQYHLLERPQDINKSDRYGRSPLMKATKSGLSEVVALLLDRGANINHYDLVSDYYNPITYHMRCLTYTF